MHRTKITYRLPCKGSVEPLEAKYAIHGAKLIRVEQSQHLMHCNVAVGIASRFRHTHKAKKNLRKRLFVVRTLVWMQRPLSGARCEFVK